MSSNVIQYKKLSKNFGNFFALYSIGFNSIKNIKWLLLNIVVSLTIEMTISYSIKIFTKNKDDISFSPKCLILLFIITVFSTVVNFIRNIVLIKKINNEFTAIVKKIFDFVDTLYINSSSEWKLNHSSTCQQESLTNVFNTYSHLGNILEFIVSEFIDSACVLFMIFIANVNVFLTAMFMMVILAIVRNYLQKYNNDNQVTKRDSAINLKISNQFISRNDILLNPYFKTIFGKDRMFDPCDGLIDRNTIWNEYNVNRKIITITIDFIKGFFLFLICCMTIYIEDTTLLLYIIYKSRAVFGLMNIFKLWADVQNISGGRMLTTFSMIEEILNCPYIINPDSTHTKDKKPRSTLKIGSTITISKLTHKISDKLTMHSKSDILLRLNKGVILLDGSKGCGKSVTMDLLAGLYDGNISKNISINGTKLHNEFRDLQESRIYVSQCIANDYRRNKKNTVTFSLRELFIGSSVETVTQFLTQFDIQHKIPKTIDEPVSFGDRGLSPGQIQTLVLASHLWTVLHNQDKFPLLLLDEPETNIDYKTTLNIFDLIFKQYNGLIIIITHCEELKKYIVENGLLRQRWTYNVTSSNLELVTTMC